MNWLLIACIILAFILQVYVTFLYIVEHMPDEQPSDEQTAQSESIPGPVGHLVLKSWNIQGLFGHMWLHGGIIHLLGNLLFLWIFGNAVCAKIGNLKFVPIYIGLGLIAAVTHLIFVGEPMIGASGAIFGIVGMFLVFFPQNDITCYWILWFLFIFRRIEFTISSYWMILFWFAFDLIGAIYFSSATGGVAYFAHVGGFLAGAALAIVLLKTGLVVMEPRYEKSLLQLIDEWRNPTQPSSSNNLYGAFQKDLDYANQIDPQTASPAKPASNIKVTSPFDEQMFQPPPSSTATDKIPFDEQGIFINVPLPEEFLRFVCTCGKKVKIPAKYAGKTARCPACKKQIKIPLP